MLLTGPEAVSPDSHKLSGAPHQILPYLRQPWDLDEALEIQHVRCPLKEVFKAGEEGKTKGR